MPRDLPVGNGTVLINFDKDYCFRDIYYPHVGQENQTIGHPSRFGVWCDGDFAWVGQEWQIKLLGPAGALGAVEGSEDMTFWTDVGQVVLTAGQGTVTDAVMPGANRHKFYRVKK